MSAAQVKWIRAALLCVGVVFILIGLATGEAGVGGLPQLLRGEEGDERVPRDPVRGVAVD